MEDKNKTEVEVVVLTNAFRETKLIENCIRQFDGHNVFHVVTCPTKSWNGELYQDETPELAKKYGADLVIEKDFETEADQFNYTISLLGNYKYIWIVDADERYLQKDITSLIKTYESSVGDTIRAKNMSVYWKNRDYEITPTQTDYPLIAVKPSVKFIKARSCEAKDTSWVVPNMYHLSYVRSDSDMYKKISTFSHADEFNFNEWYEEVWLKWTPDMMNLHPVVPEQFKLAVYNPLPEEIKI